MTEQSFDGLVSGDDKEIKEVLPEMECTAQLTKAELKDTQRGGKGFSLEWTILDGSHANKKVFEWHNVMVPPKSDSPKDVENAKKASMSGRSRIADIRQALFGSKDLGPHCATTMQFMYKPCKILIGHKKDKETDELMHFIKKYTHLGAGGATATTTAPTTTPKTGW